MYPTRTASSKPSNKATDHDQAMTVGLDKDSVSVIIVPRGTLSLSHGHGHDDDFFIHMPRANPGRTCISSYLDATQSKRAPARINLSNAAGINVSTSE